jgi:hypothetical protein
MDEKMTFSEHVNIMDEKMTLSEHVNIMVTKAFAMLGFIRRLSLEFRVLYTSLARPKVEYASCVKNPFYDVRVDRVERVQMRFIRYAWRGLGWTDIHDSPPYKDKCALLHFDTLTKRRSIACVMFIFDVLRGRVNSPNLLSVLNLFTRTMEFMIQC